MRPRFFLSLALTLLLLTLNAGCQSSPSQEGSAVEDAALLEAADSDNQAANAGIIPGALDGDFDLFQETETPVSRVVFWTGTSLVGLPFIALSYPIHKASGAEKDLVYAPAREIGLFAGSLIVAPVYATEKSWVTMTQH